MEPPEGLLTRLDRIGDLDRGGAAPGELIGELRELIREVEAGTRGGGVAERDAEQATSETRRRWSGADARRLHGT
jgi:hypothetical protein